MREATKQYVIRHSNNKLITILTHRYSLCTNIIGNRESPDDLDQTNFFNNLISDRSVLLFHYSSSSLSLYMGRSFDKSKKIKKKSSAFLLRWIIFVNYRCILCTPVANMLAENYNFSLSLTWSCLVFDFLSIFFLFLRPSSSVSHLIAST